MRAAIYTRISDARDGDTAGVDRQREDCLALCAERGWEVAAVHEDNNVSAMKRKVRPAYGALLDDVKAGRVDVVVAWATDRLYRQPRDLEGLVEALGSVQVATVKSGKVDLSTADGRMVARLLGSVSANESEKRGERVARAAAQRAKEGRYGGGRRRMGYTGDASELVPDEADAVLWAYEHVAAGGTLEAVVRDWKGRFDGGTYGGKITGVQVRDILLRPMNAGIAVYHDQEIGRTTLPVIVDEDTWRTVRAILTDPSRRTTRGRPAVSMLAPFLRCGVCDGRVNAKKRKRGRTDGGKDAVYACREGHLSRRRERMDEAIGKLVKAYLAKHAARLTRPVLPSTSKAAGKASQEAEKLRTRLDSLSHLVASGDLDPADYATATREVRARLAAVEGQIVQAAGTPRAAALISSGDIDAGWDGATDETRRGIIGEVVERITVGRGKPGVFSMDTVDVEWKD